MINATVVGNVGNVEQKQIGEHSVLEVSVASNARVKGNDVTTWVRCSLWGAQGERLAPHITKGSKVICIGELSVREFQKKDGANGYSVEMRVDRFEFGGSKAGAQQGDAAEPGGGRQGGYGGGGRGAAPAAGRTGRNDPGPFAGMGDDEVPY